MRRMLPWLAAALIVLCVAAGFALRNLPYLLELAQPAEAPPIGALKTISTAESIYRETPGNGRYTTLERLREANLVDSALGSGTKKGYLFEVHPSTTTPELLWWALARPRSSEDGDRVFFAGPDGFQYYKVVEKPEDLSVSVDPETAAVPSGFTPVGK